MHVGLLTCQQLPEADPDEPLLLQALREHGASAEMVAWDDPAVSVREYGLCVLRSTWNYYEAPERFLRWLEQASATTRLLNPLPVAQWNHHKRYLVELESRGIPVIPTLMFDCGSEVDLAPGLRERGWKDFVIKPAISAASFQTRRFQEPDFDAAEVFFGTLLAERDVLAQVFVPTVAIHGERSMVWIDGAFTHSVRKQARFAGGEEVVSDAIALSSEEQDFGRRVLAAFADASGIALESLLYARVDVVQDESGRPMLSELELIEPSLFLLQHPPALAHLANGILRFAG